MMCLFKLRLSFCLVLCKLCIVLEEFEVNVPKLTIIMFSLSLKRVPFNRRPLKKALQRLYATSIEPVRKDPSQEHYDKELKKYDTLTNIVTRTREKKPQREPFVKNLLIGKFDKEILTFPEMDLHEVRNVEQAVEQLGKVLQQKHMINVDSIGSKNFRQSLSDLQAIGLQASQFLDGRECCPLELMRFLETLSEHQLRDSLLHNEMLGVQTLNKFADDNLKKKYLYPIIKGERVTAFALNELQMTALSRMNTEAILSTDKKHWVLNGTKSFVVNGISADLIVVFAISEKTKLDTDTASSITAFLVEKDTPGVSWKKMESANIELALLTFENVQVPAENIIGQEHEGEEILKSIVGDFRISCGPACNAISRRMLNNVYQSLIEQTTSDFDLVSTEAIRSRLGEISMDLYAAESVTYLTAGLQDWYDDQDVDVESAIVKVFSSEAAYRISTTCLDLVGLPGTLKDHWVRKSHDEVLNYFNLHETNENLRMFIALQGLQYAGANLANKIKKIRNPLYHGTYLMMRIFTEHRQNSDDPQLDLELFGHLHPSCEHSSKQLEYCVKRLEFITERLLAEHGIECVNKHVNLRRLADIMIDCYVMTAVLARASRSYCTGLQFADFEMVLASVFCNMAVERVKDNVNNIFFVEHNANEKNHIAFGKRLVQSKGYFIANPISRFY